MTYLPFLPTGAISGPKVSLPVVIDIVVHQSVIEPLCRSLVRTGNREVHGDTVRVFSSNMQMWATLTPRVVQGPQLLALRLRTRLSRLSGGASRENKWLSNRHPTIQYRSLRLES